MEIYVISKRRTADDSDLSKRSKTNINQEDKKFTQILFINQLKKYYIFFASQTDQIKILVIIFLFKCIVT